MLKASRFLSPLAALLVAIGLSGCGSAGDSGQPSSGEDQPKAGNGDEQADHADADHANHMAEDSDAAKNLAELSDADRAAAEKQGTCPVSGESLGEMGKPVKVTYQGQDLFLCCPNCKASFDEDPEKYLAKLKP